MKCSFFTISLTLLFVSTKVLSQITIEPNYDNELKEKMGKRFFEKSNVNLECKITPAEEAEKLTVKWEKEGKEVFVDPSPHYQSISTGNKFGYKIIRLEEDDAGTYSCVAYLDDKEIKRANITLTSKYRVRLPENVNVVEGERLQITCIVDGFPKPQIYWRVGNETYENSDDRVELSADKGVDNAVLTIKDIQMSDRGVITCVGKTQLDTEITADTMIRIKDKYAALWPFLGICAEVFVLCAIILIYEKKRNKSELEESDTDQSPDQKNTPDHGKDSNLRHRQ